MAVLCRIPLQQEMAWFEMLNTPAVQVRGRSHRAGCALTAPNRTHFSAACASVRAFASVHSETSRLPCTFAFEVAFEFAARVAAHVADGRFCRVHSAAGRVASALAMRRRS